MEDYGNGDYYGSWIIRKVFDECFDPAQNLFVDRIKALSGSTMAAAGSVTLLMLIFY